MNKSIMRADYNRRLLLRLFDEEQDLPIYLFIDASRSMEATEKFDQARRLAAALCYIGSTGKPVDCC